MIIETSYLSILGIICLWFVNMYVGLCHFTKAPPNKWVSVQLLLLFLGASFVAMGLLTKPNPFSGCPLLEFMLCCIIALALCLSGIVYGRYLAVKKEEDKTKKMKSEVEEKW